MLDCIFVLCFYIWEVRYLTCLFSWSYIMLDYAGLDSNSRPVGDDLEHSGTSQDDGKPAVNYY